MSKPDPGLDRWATAHAATLRRQARSATVPLTVPEPRVVWELSGHTSQIWSVAFGRLSNGTLLLATTSDDHTARLWNAATGEHLHTLTGHDRLVRSAAFGAMPDGTVLLVTVSADSTARLWNPATGEHLRTLTGHTSYVRSVALANQSDGDLILATAGFDHTTRLWNPATGEQLHTLTGHTTDVRAVAFGVLPDGTLILATAGVDRTARLWNPATGEHLHTLTGHTTDIRAAAFGTLSDRTLILATASNDQTTRLWNPATGEHLHTLTGHIGPVRSVAFAAQPDGTLILATASDDRTTRIWNPVTGRQLHSLDHGRGVNGVAFAPDQPLLVTGSTDGIARVWSIDPVPQIRPTAELRPSDIEVAHDPNTFTGHTDRVNAAAFGTRSDGTLILATASSDHTARLWNPATGEHLHTFTGHTTTVWSVAFGNQSDGTLILATASSDHTARLWNPAAGTPLHTLLGHSGYVTSVAFSTQPDGTLLLATAADDRTARLWNPVTGEHLRTFTGHTRAVWSVAFATQPDGTLLLATASQDDTARLWNPATGEHLRTFTGHTDRLNSVAFATQLDGTLLLATASNDKTARLWNPATGEHLHTLAGHTGLVNSVAFATQPDGTPLLATTSGDNTTRLWNPATGEHLHTVTGNMWDTAFGMLTDGTTLLVTRMAEASNDPALWRVKIRPHLSAQERLADEQHASGGGTLRAACSGLIALSTADITPPLSVLDDLLALTGNAASDRVAGLAEHAGIERLRALRWPAAARVGLAALLLEDLTFEPVYTPPEAGRRELHQALRRAMVTHAGPWKAPTTPTAAILANADRITERTLAMLEVLGPDAVAGDPLLPLRLRDQAEAMPPIRDQIRAAVTCLRRNDDLNLAARTESADVAGGVIGFSRHGTIASLVRTELALPPDMFALRHASNDLLFRMRHHTTPPMLDDLTLVLDTSPPTFGPIETVLRLVAHCIVITLWRGNGLPHLITMSEPRRVLTMSRPADLSTIWTERSLHPPRLAEALDCAQHQKPGKVVVLTTYQLAHDHPLIGIPAVRVITTSMPEETPARASTTRYRLHLKPRPRPADIAHAVSIVLAQDR